MYRLRFLLKLLGVSAEKQNHRLSVELQRKDYRTESFKIYELVAKLHKETCFMTVKQKFPNNKEPSLTPLAYLNESIIQIEAGLYIESIFLLIKKDLPVSRTSRSIEQLQRCTKKWSNFFFVWLINSAWNRGTGRLCFFPLLLFPSSVAWVLSVFKKYIVNCYSKLIRFYLKVCVTVIKLTLKLV